MRRVASPPSFRAVAGGEPLSGRSCGIATQLPGRSLRRASRCVIVRAGVSVPYGLLPGSQGECWSFGGAGVCAEGSGGPDSDPDPSREEGLGVGHGFELWHETMVGSRVRGGRGGGLVTRGGGGSSEDGGAKHERELSMRES